MLHEYSITKTAGTTAQIALKGQGKCLDIEEALKDNGVNVQLFECLTKLNDHQSWDYTPQGTLMSRLHGKCLDAVQSDSDGANVQVWSCSGANNQKWILTPSGQILSAYNHKCLQAESDANKANVRLWECSDNDPRQIFEIRGGAPPSSRPKLKTLGGCYCKDTWSLNGKTYVYPNNCAEGTGIEKKPWCLTDQTKGVCVGNSGVQSWDYCAGPAKTSSAIPPPPPPSSSVNVVRTVNGQKKYETSTSTRVEEDSKIEREMFRGSGMARSAERQKSRAVEVDKQSAVTVKRTVDTGPIHVDKMVSCVYGKATPSGCVCQEGYTGPYCDDCAKDYFGFPQCIRKVHCFEDAMHMKAKCLHQGTCDHSTGKCICHSNFAGEHCKDCAPGFYGSNCAPAGSGGGSSHFLFFAVLFAGGAYYFGKKNRYF